ncbi:hypothetical protein ACFO3U_08055 [Flavobacterium ponti]|uniref:Uncharacterized protein n=1 Tax=Flavobacterium ponti TaxID=665133 RepID=A0ABV9P502_9FLAO
MKKIFSLLVLIINLQFTFSQESDKLDDATIETLKNNLLKNTSEKSCKCIDSINTNNKQKKQISNEINSCIDKEISIYQLATKLFEVGKDTTAGNKTINVNYNLDKNSKEYKDYYYEIERYLMENCKAIKEKAASNEIENENSVSKKKRSSCSI